MIRPLYSVLIAAALAASACGKAPAPAAPATPSAPDKELPPAPGPARGSTLPAPAERTLDNGLRVIVVPHGGTPLVTAEFDILSGSEIDPPTRPGAAAFTADLLTQGTKTRSAPQIAEAGEALGIQLAASADWDATRIGFTATTPKTDAALALLADVVRNPVFADAEIERQRAQALDSLSVALKQPRSLASLVAAKLEYGAAPYGHSRAGTPSSLKQLKRADLVSLHQTYYRPDNAVLIFAGDVDPETTFALAEKVFGDWSKPEAPLAKPAATDAPAASATPRTIAIDVPGSGQAAVVAISRVPNRTDPDYYSGLVTNAVLGGGYSARLNSEIRIKRGLSYGAGSRFQTLRDGGVLLAFAQTKNESAAEVVGLMRSEIARLGHEPVPAPELAARKANYIGNFSRELETTSGIAEQLATFVAEGISVNEINHTIPQADSIKAEQVQAYAAAHLMPNAIDIVVVGDAQKFREALLKAVPDAAVIPFEKLDLDAPGITP